MAKFKPKPGTKSATRRLKPPFAGIDEFDAALQALVLKNPLGCRSYRSNRKIHPPIERAREMFTAKFVYEDKDGRRIGTGQDMYHTVAGYKFGIAAITTHMANLAAHGGKARHLPGSDLWSVLLKCQDPNGERYFLSVNRDRITVSSYEDDEIRERVGEWVDTLGVG